MLGSSSPARTIFTPCFSQSTVNHLSKLRDYERSIPKHRVSDASMYKVRTQAPTRPFRSTLRETITRSGFSSHPKVHAKPSILDNISCMRTSGMIGGLGPESTIDYYRSIIARFRARSPDGGYPSLIVNSLDVDKGIGMLDAGRLDDLADYLAAAVEVLVRAGAEFGYIAANTPHIVFDEVQRRSAIPLLSIVRATSEYAKALGLKKVGLFGTGFTMRASFYPEEFQRSGIAMIRPTDSEREFIHRKYIDELLSNQFLPETRSEILNIARRMKAEYDIEAFVLAGTELPLLLRQSGATDIKFLDTTVIHVEAIVDRLLA